MEFNLTKEQAKQALLEGKKVVHRYFDEGEYVKQIGRKIVFEDNNTQHEIEFWKLRELEFWNDGWAIYSDKS